MQLISVFGRTQGDKELRQSQRERKRVTKSKIMSVMIIM